MTKYIDSKSYQVPDCGQNIEVLQCTRGPKNILLIGGVHGDEPEGFYLVEKFLQTPALWSTLEGKASLWIVPRLNPFGCAALSRTNKNLVDLNRNMPTKDWVKVAASARYFPGPSPASEFETRVLIDTIERLQPHLIVSAHSWNPMINYNGPCLKVAQLMAKKTGYTVSDDIGYPTPGSLGTWAGWERKLPVITLEIERDTSEEVIWKTHAEALAEALQFAADHERLE